MGIDPNELKVKSVYPDAEIGVGYSWFTVIRPSEPKTFWAGRKIYGLGETMRIAWEDAAKKLEGHSK